MTATYATVIPFAARLKALRRQRGWSQVALAVHAGMTANHVAYLELGRGEPSMTTLRRLSRAFGLTLSELLEGVE